MLVLPPGEARIEPVHHGTTQSALIRRFQVQQAQHVAAPVLVVSAIADRAYGVRFSERLRKRDHIAVIVLVAIEILALSACRWPDSC